MPGVRRWGWRFDRKAGSERLRQGRSNLRALVKEGMKQREDHRRTQWRAREDDFTTLPRASFWPLAVLRRLRDASIMHTHAYPNDPEY